jgi:hypothetical protein
MAKLSEILGGILKDISQSRIVADTLTKEYSEIYQKDPLLSHLPVPRVTIKDVTLKLKFAVDEHSKTEYGESVESEFGKQWKKELAEEVFPQIVHSSLNLKGTDFKITESARKAIEAERMPKFAIAAAFEGKPEYMIDSTVRLLTKSKRRLPWQLRKEMPRVAQLRPEVEKYVRRVVEKKIPEMRQFSAAHEISKMDMDILVKKSDLEKIQESTLQELTFTITTEDIKIFEPPGTEPEEES